MIYVLIFLQVLDLISTYVCLQTSIGRESNPWLVGLVCRIGLLPALVVAKGAIIAMVLVLGPASPEWLLGALILFYLWVVFNNFGIYLASRK
jgi:Domain of unknown function (DUF5658)